MSTLKVYDMKGASVDQIEIAESSFELVRGKQAVKDVVCAYRNAGRAGTASTKEKWAVAGSGRKPWKQKGTGQARAGYRQSPVWRGGSVVFGPKPRSYAEKVNKKVARLAFRRALSEKLLSGTICVVRGLSLDEPKTKTIAELMKAMGVSGPTLLLVDDADGNVAKSVKNLPKVEATTAAAANVYQLLRYRSVIATEDAVAVLQKRLGGVAEEEAPVSDAVPQDKPEKSE
jgi:large subunit ribosomal protein L4